jgi:two-component system, OmpR family, sensor histidine kinase VicK
VIKIKATKLFRLKIIKPLFILVLFCFSCKNKQNNILENTLDSQRKYVDSLLVVAIKSGNNLQHDKCKTLLFKALRFSETNNYLGGELKSNYALSNFYFTFQINDSCAYRGEKVLSLTEGKLLNEEDLKTTVLAMTRLAILYATTGNHSISYRYYFKTEEMVKDINDLNFQLEYNGRLAYTFYRLAQYSEAQTFYNKKLRIINLMEPGKVDPMYTQGIYRDIGLTFFNLKEYQKAINYYDSALIILDTKKLLPNDNTNKFKEAEGVVRGNKGQAYYKLNQLSNAKSELLKNVAINCQKGFDNNDAVSSLIALGNIYLEENDYQKFNSTMILIDSIYNANKLNIYFNRVLRLKALAYQKLRNKGDNGNQLKKFISWNDSLTTSLLSYNIKNKLVEKDVIKWKKEIESLNFETENTRSLFYRSLLIGILLFFGLFVSFLYLRNLRKNTSRLKKLNSEIEENQNKLKLSYSEMEKLMKEKNNIISIVAHDLRSPLSSIKGLSLLLETDLAEKKLIDDDVKNYLNYLNLSAEHMNTVTEDLVEMATLEDSTQQLEKENTNVFNLLKSIISVLEIKAKAKNIELQIECDNNLEHQLNSKKMERVISNLISNAVKFSHQNSIVNIQAKKINGLLILTFKDNGVGIEEQNLSIIFDRFTQAKNVGTKGEKPIGLGLSIVKQIVEKHHGSISVNSVYGKGSEFVIEIP